MSDKEKSPKSQDESENESLPAKEGQFPAKGKHRNRNRQNRKNAASINSNAETDKEPAASTSSVEEEDASDDALLAEIRRSLVQENTSKREKQEGGILNKVAKLIKPGKGSPAAEQKAEEPDKAEEVPPAEDVQKYLDNLAALSSWDESAPVFESSQTSDDDAQSSLLDQNGSASSLELESDELIPEQPQNEAHAQPETRQIGADYDAIRDVALENYDESPTLPEDKPEGVSLQQKFKALVYELNPIERTLILGSVILILIAALAVIGFELVNSRVATVEQSAPTQELPFPVRVSLPGGWQFNLAKGTVVNDKWSPTWAEWLQGTEICKWVALPWTLQLEAVVRSLKADDVIELTMSNTDSLKFKVLSIQSVPVDQIATLNRDTTSLLLILVNKDSDTRWVVTAIP